MGIKILTWSSAYMGVKPPTKVWYRSLEKYIGASAPPHMVCGWPHAKVGIFTHPISSYLVSRPLVCEKWNLQDPFIPKVAFSRQKWHFDPHTSTIAYRDPYIQSVFVHILAFTRRNLNENGPSLTINEITRPVYTITMKFWDPHYKKRHFWDQFIQKKDIF